MLDSRAKELCQIGDTLFNKKRDWDELCQEIAEQSYPLRTDFTQTVCLGDDFSSDLMDSFPVQARETLGNAPASMLRQGEWFEVKTGDEDVDEEPSNARWLEGATKKFRKLVQDRRANFDAATKEADHDWVAFGNPVLSVGESSGRNHMLFNSWHPKDCAWMVNDDGAVDHIQRNMMKSARNLKKKFRDNIHSDIKRACETEPAKEFKVRHIVMPTDEIYGDDRKMRKKYARFPFLSLYMDVEHQTILGEAGLPVFTYVVPRWRKLSSFAQGFSPATINSLPDMRMLQALARIILEQGEKAVDPPIVARGEIFRDAINLYAGGMTFVDIEGDEDLRQMMQTVATGNMQVGAEMKADVRELIAEAFLLNKLFLPDAREMTAFETGARLAEFRRAALPFFGPIESEYHLPLLDTAFQLAINNRHFDFSEMPEDLMERDVTFTFNTPLNTADGRAKVAAYQESIQLIAAGAQFDQSIPAGYDLKKATEDAVRGTGAPADWKLDETAAQEGEAQVDQVAQLQQAATMLQQGASVAQGVGDAAQSLQAAGVQVA